MTRERQAQTIAGGRQQELLTGLRELLALTDQLDGLSREQSSHVETARADALMSVLSARQTLVERAGAARVRLAWALTDWDRTKAQLVGSVRSEAESLIRQIRERSLGVSQRDLKDAESLRVARGEVGRELTAIARRGAAARAYGHTSKPSVFHDGEA